VRESLSFTKLKGEMKVKATLGSLGVIQFILAQHRPVMIASQYGWERAYTLGPERWWTMPEQDEARGNSGGGP